MRTILKKLSSINYNLLQLIAGTSTGRLLGLLRDILIVMIFGISLRSDEIYYLLLFPDLFNNLLSWSMIVTIFLPQITKSKIKSTLFNFYHSKFEIFSVSLILFASLLLILFNRDNLLVEKFILFWTFYFGVKFGFGLIKEQYHEKFRSTSTANVFYNTGVILAIIAAYYSTIAFSVVILFITYLRYINSKRLNKLNNYIFIDDDLSQGLNKREKREKLVSVFLAIGCLSFLGINFTLDKFIISDFANEGILTSYSIAEKLSLLPLSILIIPYLNEIYPKISRLESVSIKTNRLFKKPIRFIIVITLIQNIGTILVHFTANIYNLSAEYNIEQIVNFLLLFNLSILFYGITLHLVNIFVSLNKILPLFIVLTIVFTFKFIFLFSLKVNDPNLIIWSNIMVQIMLNILLFYLLNKSFKK